MLDTLTFALAYLAYVLLGVDVVLRLWKHARRQFTAVVVVVLVTHVALVWGHRFGGSLQVALEKSIAGFVIFHLAFLLIVLAAVVPRERVATWLLYVAFPVCTAGALGAAFRYEYVASYQVPLLLAALVVLLLGSVPPRAGGGRSPARKFRKHQ